MQIADLRIRNFRSIRDMQIRDIENALILVGKNDTGKTAVLDAVRAAGGDYTVRAEDFREDFPNVEVSVKLRIEEDDLKRFHRFGMVSAYRRYDSWYRDFCRKLPSYEPDGEASGGVLSFDFSVHDCICLFGTFRALFAYRVLAKIAHLRQISNKPYQKVCVFLPVAPSRRGLRAGDDFFTHNTGNSLGKWRTLPYLCYDGPPGRGAPNRFEPPKLQKIVMNTIDNYDFRGKRAIIRVDFNVPLDEQGNVTDMTRIRAAVPTIRKVLEGGGSVILMSHLGRPKKNNDMKYSLRQIVPAVEQALGCKVLFAGDCMGEEAARMARELKPGEVMMLENLRFYAEEEGKPRGLAEDASEEEKSAAKKAVKASQKEFVKKLASYADVYINDAFGTAHRAHASTALIADLFPNDKMFGYVMENELKAIDKVLDAPQRPFLAILGGSKVSTKITIIERLMDKVDKLILGGGMTYTFMAAQGGKVGRSICEPDQFDTARAILEKAKAKGIELVLAQDALIADDFSEHANTRQAPSNDIPDGWEGVDIGEEAKRSFREVILSAKTILWNGPVGVFEIDKFATGTRAVADAIVEATAHGAYSLVGGGDSVAAVNKFGLADKVSYVSTGGGALLEYMEGIELPGVAAIRK